MRDRCLRVPTSSSLPRSKPAQKNGAIIILVLYNHLHVFHDPIGFGPAPTDIGFGNRARTSPLKRWRSGPSPTPKVRARARILRGGQFLTLSTSLERPSKELTSPKVVPPRPKVRLNTAPSEPFPVDDGPPGLGGTGRGPVEAGTTAHRVGRSQRVWGRPGGGRSHVPSPKPRFSPKPGFWAREHPGFWMVSFDPAGTNSLSGPSNRQGFEGF